MSVYLKGYFDDDLLFSELLEFQKHMITMPDCDDELINFSYDWLSYFEDIYDMKSKTPEQKQVLIRFINKNGAPSRRDYARRIVWYGKRDNLTVNNVFAE